jgi:N-acyl-D-aspartate/D-glutamate deacylase
MLDIIIRGGTVVDGTGAPAVRADVGIRGKEIAVIGDLAGAEAAESLDAGGLHVSPGFIDMHAHSDLSLMEDPHGQSKIRQGVTTEVVGQCGFTPYPFTELFPRPPASEMDTAFTARIDDFDWKDLAGYAARIARKGSSINICELIGHASVRAAVMGYDDRPPTPAELEAMRRLVAQGMEQGAFGFSTGLTLVPSAYAEIDEVVELAKVAARYDGFYDTHGRFWSGWHFKAAEEAIEVGRRAGLPVEIAHIALIDPRQQGKAAELAGILERANAEGIDVTYDVYPYVASGSMLSQFLPGWVQEGGVPAMMARLRDPQTRQKVLRELDGGWFRGIPWAWDTIFVAAPGSKGDRAWTGKHVQQMAEAWGVEPKEAFLRLLDISEDGVFAVCFNRTEEDMQYFLRHRLGLIGSDGSAVAADGPFSTGNLHPRYYGAFPRILGRYVRELKVLTVEQAVHKMTGAAARRLRLTRRGRIAPGYIADITLFDLQTVADRATFEKPHQYAAGIPHVMVSGQWVLRAGAHTGAFPTGVIRPA